MIARMTRLCAMIGLGMLLAGGAGAAEERASFSVAIGGVSAGSLSMAANREGDRYTVRADLKGGGVVAALVNFSFGGVASGRIGADGKPAPVSYDATREVRDDKRRTQISYRGGRPASVGFTPARTPRSYDIDPRAQTGTMDPISATYALLGDQPAGQACGRTIEIFDGTRRSRLIISKASGSGASTICNGVYRRVAGYSAKAMSERTDYPFTLFYEPAGDKMRLMRFETQSLIGKAVARRR